MPTQRRKVSGTGFYHIVVKGINNERIFNQHREKSYFKKIILEQTSKFESQIYAYCIMSNHAHFIIRAEIQILSLFMARILAEYASYYNYKHYRNGHVFQNRFSSECIETEYYLWNCIRYIHLNPVKANMVKKAENYKYSSMGEYTSRLSIMLHTNAFAVFKQKFRDYKDFVDFHKIRYYETFLDTPAEIQQQQEEMALQIANEIYIKRELKLQSQVFEEKKLREEYIGKIKQNIKVSNKRAKELYETIKRQIENV